MNRLRVQFCAALTTMISPALACAQFGISYSSELELLRNDTGRAFDTMTSQVSGTNLLPRQSHSLTYTRPNGHEFGAHSEYSVDSVELTDLGNEIADVFLFSISGVVSRSAYIPPDYDEIYGGVARASQAISIEFDPPTADSFIWIDSYTLTASQTFTYSDSYNNDYAVLEMNYISKNNGNYPLSVLTPPSTDAGTYLYDTGPQIAGSGADRIDISMTTRNPISLDNEYGEHTFEYNLEFYLVMYNVPSPATAAPLLTLGLVAIRRRR